MRGGINQPHALPNLWPLSLPSLRLWRFGPWPRTSAKGRSFRILGKEVVTLAGGLRFGSPIGAVEMRMRDQRNHSVGFVLTMLLGLGGEMGP